MQCPRHLVEQVILQDLPLSRRQQRGSLLHLRRQRLGQPGQVVATALETTSITMTPSLSVSPAECPCLAIASASSLCSSVTRFWIRSHGPSPSSTESSSALTARASTTAGVAAHGWSTSGISSDVTATRSSPVAANAWNSRPPRPAAAPPPRRPSAAAPFPVRLAPRLECALFLLTGVPLRTCAGRGHRSPWRAAAAVLRLPCRRWQAVLVRRRGRAGHLPSLGGPLARLKSSCRLSASSDSASAAARIAAWAASAARHSPAGHPVRPYPPPDAGEPSGPRAA